MLPAIPSNPEVFPTIGDVLSFYCPRLRRNKQCPSWPPDVFGLMSVLLELSGAYLCALRKWPPPGFQLPDPRTLHPSLEPWRRAWNDENESNPQAPSLVKKAWRIVVVENWKTPINALTLDEKTDVAAECLKLLALADSISHDLLNPLVDNCDSRFDYRALIYLFVNQGESGIGSIGREVKASRLTILPKRRTPKTGLSLRSLSLYLGAVRTSEVHAEWYSDISPMVRITDSKSRSLLLIPSPEEIAPRQFEPVLARPGDMSNMDAARFGFLTLRPNIAPKTEADRILALLEKARESVRSIDAIVLPESSISDEVLDILLRAVQKMPEPIAVLAGVAQPAVSGIKPGENKLAWIPRYLDPKDNVRVQFKHHRWQIDKSQIAQYQLGSSLDPELVWWEYIELRQRQLNFIQFAPWLTVAPLICEDLARPDPVSEILRAFGPDLVIALLMDGPQLQHRWAARNAMTLADDPGCAVLTLTCAGMVDLSNTRQPDRRRVVALYKEPGAAAQEIELPQHAGAIILTLSRSPVEEWSADGRCSMPGKDFHPVLSGVRYVKKIAGP